MSSVPFLRKLRRRCFIMSFLEFSVTVYSIESVCDYAFMMRCTILYHLYNLKNVKNIHGGV